MIYVTSLNKYRLNVIKVRYLIDELTERGYECKEYDFQDTTSEDIILLVNAVNKIDKELEGALMGSTSKKIYLVNDTNAYYPNLNQVILSQFKGDKRSDGFIDLASLHLRGKKYTNTRKADTLIYWGHFKEERRDGYIKYIPNNPSTVIIGDKEEWESTHSRCTFIPYKRDLDELYKSIASIGTRTIMIGDKYHNGINIASRYYEALNCGLSIGWDPELLGTQNISEEVNLGDLTDLLPSNLDSDIDIDSLSGEELVKAKGNSYGSYGDGVRCRGKLMEALEERYMKYHSNPMPDNLRIPLTDISIKLSRMMSDPRKEDNYTDLIGYSILLKEVAYEGK